MKDELFEKSKSKSQQRLFGMVVAYKKGELDLEELPSSLAEKIKKIADGQGKKGKRKKGISYKDAEDFAKTKHKGLPEKVQEHLITKFDNYINEKLLIDEVLDKITKHGKNSLTKLEQEYLNVYGTSRGNEIEKELTKEEPNKTKVISNNKKDEVDDFSILWNQLNDDIMLDFTRYYSLPETLLLAKWEKLNPRIQQNFKDYVKKNNL